VKAAVLGSPVSHSLSPVLHRAAYAALGLRGWSYSAIDCREPQLADLLGRLDESWAGLSLTMPLKRAVLPWLDDVDPLAEAVGGANTVVFRGGRRRGFNTDVGGMVDALAGAGVITGAPIAAAPALVIGAGATACAALAALREIGFRHADVAARDTSRAGELLAAAQRLGVGVGLRDLSSLGRGEPRAACGGATARLVICTIPPRAADSVAPSLCGPPRGPDVVFDVAYDPWPTRLAEAAQAAGCAVVAGFELLVHQAARQVELMTGQTAPREAMRRAGLAELAERQDLGAPGTRRSDPHAE